MLNKIIGILKKIRPDIDYTKENHLLSAEVLDSYDIILILAELSDQFMIDIDPDDVTEEYFDDVKGIEKLIDSLVKKKNL